jgi:hypothetical protein
VQWERDGETFVKEEAITLTAGDSRTLEFTGETKVAAAR